MTAIDDLGWPARRLGDALEAVAVRSGLTAAGASAAAPRGDTGDVRDPGRRLADLAAALGVEVEHVETPYARIEALLRASGPAVLQIGGTGGDRFVALLSARGRDLRVLGPDGRVHRVPVAAVREALCREIEGSRAAAIDDLLHRARVPRGRVAAVRALVGHELLSARRVTGIWLVRLPPGASFAGQAVGAGVIRPLTVLVAAHVARVLLLVVGWRVLGEYALGDGAEPAWLLAWLLLLIGQVPLQGVLMSTQGHLSLALGGLLRHRLLAGALALDPEEVRDEGSGQLLGRVIEIEELEALSLTGGFAGLFALIELVAATVVLAVGPGGALSIAALAAVVVTGVVAARAYLAARDRATRRRGHLTHEVVEGIIGHRTRIAQASRAGWHDREDSLLADYVAANRAADRHHVVLRIGLPRLWLVLGFLTLAPAVGSAGARPEGVAVALGGILLARTALARFGDGVVSLAGAVIAWRRVQPLFDAAARPDAPGTHRASPRCDQPLLEAHGLELSFPGRSEPVLRGVTLAIGAGDRVLVEGPSGGGKSTLVSLLGGRRRPSGGVLLLRGLDRDVLGGRAWREQVAIAPQFHENHILTASLAFNLLMGRAWPPSAESLAEAESTCRELGLGELLDRMPAGLEQMVGESGWQLSHGEKSRIYLARALLQRAPVVVLDESFAALDPATLANSLRSVLARDVAIVVIAHP